MSDLSPGQLKFLATYLHVVPNPKIFKGKRKKAIDYNDRVTAEYEAYLEKKAEADAMLADVEKRLAASGQLRRDTPKDGLSDGAKLFFDRMDKAAKLHDSYNRQAISINVAVITADAENPGFDKGRRDLETLIYNLSNVHSGLPDMPPSLQSGTIGLLFGRKREIDALAQFKGSTLLNDKVVNMPLPDDTKDQRRLDLLKQHGDLCKAALGDIDRLIADAKRNETAQNSATYADGSETVLTDLQSDLAALEKTIVTTISSSARDKLTQLVATGDDLAKREVERLNIISDTLTTLTGLTDKLGDEADDLRKAHKTAETPSAKRDLAREYHEVQDRLTGIETRKNQLQAYEDQLVLRTAKIDVVRAEMQIWAADPAAAMLAEMPDPLTGLSRTPNKAQLLGSDDGNVVGQIDILRAQYDGERKRLRLDAKLFPNETDLTYLNETQHKTLLAMLDEAEKFAKADALDKAEFAVDRTIALHAKINLAARSALPAPVAKAPSEQEQTWARLSKIAVKLDRLWGQGGDGDKALRTTLDRIDAAHDTELAKDLPDFTRINSALDGFEKQLDRAIAAFRPQPGDMLTRDKAKEARNTLITGLLGIYKTSELQIAQLDSVPENKLLTLEKDGVTHYYQIETKHDGTLDRRGDHDIPREAMDALLQQANMLEMLANGGAPDCAKAITAATDKAKADFEAISKGGADYKHVAKTVISCDKLLADKLFTKWIPEGFFETRTKFNDFKDSYKSDLLPAAAKAQVDTYLGELTAHKAAAEKLKKDYDEVKKLVEAVEDTLKNGKHAEKPNLVQKLQELVDKAPGSLQGAYVAEPEDTAELMPLINEMQANLAKISPALKKDGLEGAFKDRVTIARSKLETRSGPGIEAARADAAKIKQDMQTELAQLGTIDSMAAIRKLATFLKTEGAGQEKITNAKAAVEADTKIIDKDLDAAEKALKEARQSLGTYEEYMDVHRALKSQFDTLKKNEDPVAAADQLRQLKTQASQLKDEVTNLCNIAAGKGEGVDFVKWEAALKTKFADVSKEAATVAAEIRKRALETTIEPGDGVDQTEADRQTAEIRDAAEDAAKTLDLIVPAKFDKILTLDPGLTQAATNALRIADDAAARKEALNAVREKALAEVRRMRQQIDSHPALNVYRDNPFSIKSWPPFLGAMHGFDVMVLTKLKPV